MGATPYGFESRLRHQDHNAASGLFALAEGPFAWSVSNAPLRR
jgi:hypothetical protein